MTRIYYVSYMIYDNYITEQNYWNEHDYAWACYYGACKFSSWLSFGGYFGDFLEGYYQDDIAPSLLRMNSQ